jgi:hypothetical protein
VVLFVGPTAPKQPQSESICEQVFVCLFVEKTQFAKADVGYYDFSKLVAFEENQSQVGSG